MFRVGFILLTTIALLICPYRCAVRSAMAAPQTQAKQGCSCCATKCLSVHEGGAAIPAELPSQPIEGEDSCVCVCDGAVFTATVIVITACVSWIDCRDLTARMSLYHAEQFAFDHGPPDGLESGLCPRLSMQSLLL